jgi:acyl-CoA synthetase (AMP-forming)/AMP-acid ligase II
MKVPQPIARRGPANLAEMIDATARIRPLAPALVAPGRPDLTYAQLGTFLRETVAAFHAMGVKRGDRVAVVLPNGPEMAVAVLVAATCATCAPLNPGLRTEDFRAQLGDLLPALLLLSATDVGPVRRIAEELAIRCVDVSWSETKPAGIFTTGAQDRSASVRAPPADVDDIALVLFTTGTTSRPKLVPLTHRNLCSSAVNVAGTLALGPGDRCLNLMPMFHIHGLVAALLASLSAGASVACTPGLRDGNFVAWLDELRPTWYTAVPAIHEAVLAQIASDPTHAAAGRLRFVRSSSAPLPMHVARALEAALAAPVIEAYGMTEAAHQIASNPLPPRPRKPGTVGLPAGPEVAILVESGRIVDRDAAGEIVIRGDNVTSGYVADPEATRSAFVDGWFRTGDLGRIGVDGYIALTGRLKDVINRGGEKVSPREIDEALLEHPAVGRGVAFAVAHPTLGEDIAAAVVLRTGTHATEHEIRSFLFDRIAGFKIPSRVLIVDDIPLGDTGKIRRVDLAAHFADRLTSSRVDPRDEIESLVAALFADVLGVDRVGATDNFFVLGGDSLRGGQLLARLRARLGISLLPLALFNAPTVAEFAREIAGVLNRSVDDTPAKTAGPTRGLVDAASEPITTRKRRRRTF